MVSKKKVVVIGGGFAGSKAAQELEHDFSVTLIDTKNYFEFTPSVLRVIIEPEHLKKIQVLHNHYLHHAHIIQEEVVSITPQEVILKNKKKVSFDYLVITSGSSYVAPFKGEQHIIPTRAETLRACHSTLDHSEKVLLIGGGLVGVELAAEIVEKYPHKKVTIVHSGDRLIPRNHERCISYAERWLTKRGVEILYDERIDGEGRKSKYTTSSGKTITAEMCFFCTGIRVNNEFLKKHFSESLNERGALLVDDTLQIPGYPHIFAAGDVSALKEEKTAQAAEKAGHVIACNIRQLEKSGDLHYYIPKKRPMLISLGRKTAMMDAGSFTLEGFFPSLLKSFVEWKTMRRFK